MTTVLPYFRNRLTALGYKEWTDALNFENIPSTRLNSIFHLEIGAFSSVGKNHIVQGIRVPVSVRVFNKAYRQTGTGRDEAIKDAQAILKSVCKDTESKTQTTIKDVSYESTLINEIDVSNDNIFLIELRFSVLINIDVNN